MNKSNNKNSITKKINCTGQGIPENTQHCFILDIAADNISIYETYDYKTNDKTLKATLNTLQWDNIKESVFTRINQFMQQNNYKKNRIIKGINYINVSLAKEITLLFWGIESTNNIKEIESALKNWNGLDPIERTYLYTMTNANLSIDHLRGWRGAIKKILIEN